MRASCVSKHCSALKADIMYASVLKILMGRLFAFLILLVFRGEAAVDPAAVLMQARHAVAAQLARAANYTCVQTINRRYLGTEQQQTPGCTPPWEVLSESLWMRDRLRLDVAVSEGNEIYSWHGESKFTSADVSDVVQTGPVSSGNFIGFLRNIFLMRGAQFKYTGENEENGSPTYNFDYAIPLPYSAYHVQATQGKPTIPYHGSFSIAQSTYQLTRLLITGESLPADSPICSVTTAITYQLVSISGQPSLIPASFVLDVSDRQHVHTVSSSDYSQCREFRGESVVHFEFADAGNTSSAAQSKVVGILPAGLELHVQLQTAVDGGTSYAGDLVRGVVIEKVKVPGTGTIVPKGAFLEGFISKLESHFSPTQFQIFSVKFDRLTYGNTSFLMNAWPMSSSHDEKTLRKIYGPHLPDLMAQEAHRGLFVMMSPNLKLDGHFSGHWLTSGIQSSGANSPAAK